MAVRIPAMPAPMTAMRVMAGDHRAIALGRQLWHTAVDAALDDGRGGRSRDRALLRARCLERGDAGSFHLRLAAGDRGEQARHLGGSTLAAAAATPRAF